MALNVSTPISNILLTQLFIQDVRRSVERVEHKKPNKTSFGPEQDNSVVVAIKDKKNVQVDIVRDALVIQQ